MKRPYLNKAPLLKICLLPLRLQTQFLNKLQLMMNKFQNR